MTVPVVFEGGILQNDELFSFLEEVKSKVPDIVNSKDDKTFLINYKKEISATINEIDLSEKKQIDEMIQIFRDRNPRVWEARSELAGIVKKITQLIFKGQRIMQGVFVKYLTTDDDNANGKRTGGFGSTGEV